MGIEPRPNSLRYHYTNPQAPPETRFPPKYPNIYLHNPPSPSFKPCMVPLLAERLKFTARTPTTPAAGTLDTVLTAVQRGGSILGGFKCFMTDVLDLVLHSTDINQRILIVQRMMLT